MNGNRSGGSPSAPLEQPFELVQCPHCEQMVPPGHFCAACGHDLTDPIGGRRRHAYAANPNEPVLSLRLVSTVFPHLPHRRAAPFGAAIAAIAVVLVALALLRLTGPAIVVAAAALPVLHLFYLYETEVYEDRPLLAVGSTLGIGALLGIGFAELTGRTVTTSVVSTALFGANTENAVVSGVVLPLVGAALALVGPALLRMSGRYDEVLDGFSFGAASAFGFVLATTIVNRLPELHSGIRADQRSPLVLVVEVAQSGLLIPILAATTTGLLSAGLWLLTGPTRAHKRFGVAVAIDAVVVIAADVTVGLVSVHERRPEYVFVIAAAVTGLVLLRARFSLHEMLLAEAVNEIELGPWEPCSHCHRLVPRLPFCPSCGIATRATPKTGAGRDLRQTRDRKVRDNVVGAAGPTP